MNRREFSSKIRVAAFERAGGHCEECGARLFPGNVHFDHRIADGLGGEPTLDNCRAVCRACHSVKTRTQDVPAIAKAKRRQRHAAGIKKPRTITSWRRFDGSIVIAPRER